MSKPAKKGSAFAAASATDGAEASDGAHIVVKKEKSMSPTVQDPAVQERIAAVRKWLEANGTYEQRQEWLAIQNELAADLKLWKKAMIRFYFRHPEFYQLLWAHHRLMARFHALSSGWLMARFDALSSGWPGISVCVDEEAIATFMLADKEFDRVPENQRVTPQGGDAE